MEQYQRQHSLWNLIMEHVPDSELAEVRNIIGEALIDLYTDLYSEVETWEQIWDESCSVQRSGKPKTTPLLLADPPAVKALLKAEIQLLLLSVRERAAGEGRDGGAVLSRYSPSVVSYALGNDPTSPRSSVENGDAPSRSQSRQSQSGSRSSSRLSSVSSLKDEIESMKTKLNVSHMDEIVSHLQSVLMEDCEALKKEVQFLQECVEQTHHTRADGALAEPTVTELKEQRKVIQMDLQRQQLQMRAAASPDKAASPGPLPCSRQRTGCRGSDLRMYHNPTPALASAAVVMTTPRPPSSQELLHQISASRPKKLPGPTPSPELSAHLLQGPAAPAGPEGLDPLEVQREQACRGPDASLLRPCPSRPGGSRVREPSLSPLATSPPASPSELGRHTVPRERCRVGRPENCALPSDGLNRPPHFSGNHVPRSHMGTATMLPPSRANGDVEGRPAKRLPLDALVPCPPTSPKPANRGQSVARRVGLPQLDRLVSPS